MIDVAVAHSENYIPAFDVKINVDNLKISIEDICSRMSGNITSLDAHFQNSINDIFLLLPEKCHICAGYVIYPVYYEGTGKGDFSIGDAHFNMGKIVRSQLKKSSQIAIFACTIGPGMENWSKQVMQSGDPAQGYLIDMTASAVTEKTVDYLHDFVGSEMKKQNLNITNRYSPGYCDWPVSDQHLLFSMLPENFCGIRLSESALMQPIKSVSGIIGIGSNVEFRDYLCDRCNIKDCTYHEKQFKDSISINKGIVL